MANKEGLSIGYRLWWNIRRLVLTVLGPAQLGDADPLYRLKKERADKVAAYQAKQAGTSGPEQQQRQKPY